LLAREIDYLRNYIELQTLRLVSPPGITLEANLEDVPDACCIAPILLIPFVENAFKHGISFQQKSWIKVSLHYAAGQLFFDLYNSTHPRPEHDRLAAASGVGLADVKQRLALLYPHKHELLIRQTQGEYFVHLTLDL